MTLGCAAIGFARRLPEGAQAPLARPLGPLEDARPRPDHDRGRLGRDPGRLPRHRDLLPDHRRQHRPRHWFYFPFLFVVIAGTVERRQPHRRPRRARCRHVRDLAAHVPRDRRDLLDPLRRGRPAQRQLPRRRDLRRRADRRRDRLPLVQRVPGRGVHGRHGLDGARRCDRRPRRDDADRGAPDLHRRHLPDRGALGDDPGRRASSAPGNASS